MPQEAQKGPSDATAAETGARVSPEMENPAEGGLSESQKKPLLSDQQPKEESFSRSYVEDFRAENKEARLKAQQADWWATEARRLAIREACQGIVSDPEAVTWDDAWVSDDKIDHSAIRVAAEAVAKQRPWLAKVRGSIAQGEHGDVPAGLSLSQLLRS